MNDYKTIISVFLLLTFLLLVQCGGGNEVENGNENGPVDTIPPENGENEETAFFSAPTEYGYSLDVAEVEGISYITLRETGDEAGVLLVPGEKGRLVSCNYWNGFVYYGELIEGSIIGGGICSVKMLDPESGEDHVLCIVETEPADRIYGQVIAAAGLVFIAAERNDAEEKGLTISCFDIETGDDLAEWSGVGEDIEFISGCGTATPETVFFQVSDGGEFTLYTREDRTFASLHSGLSGRFDAENGFWLFAEEKVPDNSFISNLDDSGYEPNAVFPALSDDITVTGYPVYYSYRLRDGEKAPLLSAKGSDDSDAGKVIDGDPATVWMGGGSIEKTVRVGFGAPLRIASMFILPYHTDPEMFGESNRVKKAQVETSSGFTAEAEFPDKLSLNEIQLINDGEIPPEIDWISVSVLEVYEGENGETCIAEISFDIR